MIRFSGYTEFILNRFKRLSFQNFQFFQQLYLVNWSQMVMQV